jgi:prephenate dehydratase
VPFENSTFGCVFPTLTCFADRDNTYPDIVVCGEVYLDVHHCLVGHRSHSLLPDDAEGSGACTPTAADPNPLRPRVKPLHSLKHVRKILSHQQAFGQCVAFLSAYLKGVEQIEVSSTSRAAEEAKLDESGACAAISSEVTARMHGLEILAKNIEDREDNTTRFFIIRSRSQGDIFSLGSRKRLTPGTSQPKHKSLVSFTVPHHMPGALAEVLDGFRRFRLNLTSINSRPSLSAPFQYLFFVEFEGHKLDDPEQRVEGALGEVERASENWRWLGSWENHLIEGVETGQSAPTTC